MAVDGDDHRTKTLTVLATGVTHTRKASKLDALRETASVVVYDDAVTLANPRGLSVPIASLHADGTVSTFGADEACRELVASFAGPSETSTIYQPASDDSRWSIELSRPPGAQAWTIRACLAYWGGHASAVQWSSKAELGDEPGPQFWPVNRRFAWIVTNPRSGAARLSYLDAEKQTLVEVPLGRETSRQLLLPFGEDGVLLTDESGYPRSLSVSGRGAKLELVWATGVTQSAWPDQQDVWSVANDTVQVAHGNRDGGKFKPCASPDSLPTLLGVRNGRGWGYCGDRSDMRSFGFVDLGRVGGAVGHKIRSSVQIGKHVFDTIEADPISLPCEALVGEVAVELGVEGSERGKVYIGIYSGSGTWFADDRKATEAPRPLNGDRSNCVPGESATLYLTYFDPRGNTMTATWSLLTAVPPTATTAGPSAIFSGLVAGLLALLATFCLTHPRWPGTVRGFGHLGLIAAAVTVPLGTGTLGLPPIYDARTGTIVHLICAGLGLLMCFLSPALFWRVTTAPPLQFVTRGLLKLRWVRRRQLMRICEATEQATTRLGGQFAGDYYPLPLTPVRVGGPDSRSHLIEGESGTGKTFYLRQRLLDACTAFKQSRDLRLPLLVAQPRRRESGDAARPRGILTESVLRMLTAHGVPDPVALDLTLRGALLLGVDGLSEGDLTPADLRTSVQEMSGTHVIATARPSGGLRHVFAELRSAISATTLLDELNIEDFCARRGAPGRLTQTLRDLIREGGSYRPLLVVIALHVSQADVTDIVAIFRACFLQMANPAGDTLQAAEADLERCQTLCLATYWCDGERTFETSSRDGETTDLIRRLLLANILQPAGAGAWERGRGLPERVRFFHDLMQTYLTALALLREFTDRPRRRQEILVVSAGHPHFGARGAASDLFRAWTGARRLQDQMRLRDDLAAILTDWCALGMQINESLPGKVVIDAAPSALKSQLREQLAAGGTIAALRAADRSIAATGESTRLYLVGQMAPSIIQQELFVPIVLETSTAQASTAFESLLRAICDDDDRKIRDTLDGWDIGREEGIRGDMPGETASAAALAAAAATWIGGRALELEFLDYLETRTSTYRRDIRILGDQRRARRLSIEQAVAGDLLVGRREHLPRAALREHPHAVVPAERVE